MSQRSITSFFARITPKPQTEVDKKDVGNLSASSSKENEDGKRQREASSNESYDEACCSSEVKTTPLRKTAKRSKVGSTAAQLKPEILAILNKSQESAKRPSEESNSDTADNKKSHTIKETKSKIKGKKRKKIIVQTDSSSDENEINPEKENGKKMEVEEKIQDLKNVNGKSPLSTSTDKRRSSRSESEDKDTGALRETAKTEKKDVPKDTSKDSKSKNKQVLNIFFGKKAGQSGNDTKNNGSVYNPQVSKYHPIDDATWKHGEKVPYMALARTLEEIENISARLKMVEILSNYLRSVMVLSPEDLLPSVYMCLNQLAPAYEGLELGIADQNLIKAIAQTTGRTIAQIKADAQASGDLGIVAEHSKNNQRMIFQPAPLTVRGVFEKLKEIAKMSGHASQAKKVEKIQSIFVACKSVEARFFIRSLSGKLRIGLAEQSVLQALALACTRTPPNQTYPFKILNTSKNMSSEAFKGKYEENALTLKTTYSECPNYEKIIPVILKDGIEKLPEFCKLEPGVPLKPMLAHPTKGIQEVLQRFEGMKFTCEWKYDGERAQIHISEKGEVSIYSRNQENNTSKYPDIISRLENCKTENVKSCILDCEAVAWDKENNQILPFQILSTRKRKDANVAEIKVQVCVFMFDLLYFNGEPLVKKSFAHRRSLLKEHFKEKEGEWWFAKAMDTKTMEEVQEFLEESIKGNCEGLMVKTLEEEATYEIAKRSRNWLKLKKDYLDGVGDTLDLVVIGGYIGKGKRTGTYGGYLLACYDQDNEEYQSICKIGTGFSDEDLQKHSEFLKNHKIPSAKSYYRYDSAHEPDHWFDPVQVWEIKCADLSLSPVHRAAMGIVDPEKGISLRFPRFVRIRDDKGAEDATSAQQVADMYSNQDQIKNQGTKAIDEEDFY